jgi:hypothetical protein
MISTVWMEREGEKEGKQDELDKLVTGPIIHERYEGSEDRPFHWFLSTGRRGLRLGVGPSIEVQLAVPDIK